MDLEPDPTGGFYRWLYLDPCPPSLQFSEYPVPVRALIRPEPLQATSADQVPAWLADLGSHPVVYVTLGTVRGFSSDAAFFELAMEALAAQPVEVVITVGPSGDPGLLGAAPDNVRIERFIPQAALLAKASLVVSNAGSGSTLGALACGVPVLAVPNAAAPSQVRNATAVEASGAGRMLERQRLSTELFQHAVMSVLADTNVRSQAAAIRAEIEDMPAAPSTVPLLVQLAERGMR
jgi:MGT family glycosyltransferase